MKEGRMMGGEAFPVPQIRQSGGSMRWIADKLSKHKKLEALLQLFLKYVQNILIHQFDHTEFSDGTLPIFQNF